MKYKYWYYITFSLVILLHFAVIKIANFNLTIPLLILPFWNFITFKFSKKVKKFFLVLILFLAVLPLINLNLSIFIEFLKTYLLYFLFIIQLFILFSFKIRNIDIIIFQRMVLGLQYSIIIYSLIQFILLKYFNSGILFNPWGSFQAFNQYNYSLYTTHIRAIGFYLEPSVLGLIIIMLFWIRHILENSLKKDNFIITIVGLYITNSFSAYSSFFVIVMFYFTVKLKYKYIIYIFILIILISILPYIPRANEYMIEGSSTYWRFIAPIIILSDLIPNHLLGLPFGSYQDIISNYGLYNGSKVGNSIDNGHLLLVYYFGIIPILFYIGLIYYFVKNNNYIIKSYIIYFLITYNFTGAIFNIEYVFLIMILPIVTIKLTRRNYDYRYHNNNLQ